MKLNSITLSFFTSNLIGRQGGVEQFVTRLTRHRSLLSWNIKRGSQCFLMQTTLSSLLSTGWFKAGSSVVSQSNKNELRALCNIEIYVHKLSLLYIYHQNQYQNYLKLFILSQI